MKKIRKTILLILLMIFTLGLFSCTRQSDREFIENLLKSNSYRDASYDIAFSPFGDIFNMYAYYKCDTLDELDSLLAENNLLNVEYSNRDIRSYIEHKNERRIDLGLYKCTDLNYYGVYISETTYKAIINKLSLSSNYLSYADNEFFYNYRFLYWERDLIKDYIDLDNYDCSLHYIKLEGDYAQKKISGYRLLALMICWKSEVHFALERDKLGYSIYSYSIVDAKETKNGLYAYPLEEGNFDPRKDALIHFHSYRGIITEDAPEFPQYPSTIMDRYVSGYLLLVFHEVLIEEIDGIKCIELVKGPKQIDFYNSFIETIKDCIVKEEVLGENDECRRYYIDCYKYLDFLKEISENKTSNK